MSHDDDTCPHLVVLGRLEAENARLKAKVERLTQAGNAMAVAVKLNDDVFDNLDKDKTIANWNAAKEGKGQP